MQNIDSKMLKNEQALRPARPFRPYGARTQMISTIYTPFFITGKEFYSIDYIDSISMQRHSSICQKGNGLRTERDGIEKKFKKEKHNENR